MNKKQTQHKISLCVCTTRLTHSPTDWIGKKNEKAQAHMQHNEQTSRQTMKQTIKQANKHTNKKETTYTQNKDRQQN